MPKKEGQSEYRGPEGPIPELEPGDISSIFERAGKKETLPETEPKFKPGDRVYVLRSPNKDGRRKIEFDWTFKEHPDKPGHFVAEKTNPTSPDQTLRKSAENKLFRQAQQLEGDFDFDPDEARNELARLESQVQTLKEERISMVVLKGKVVDKKRAQELDIEIEKLERKITRLQESVSYTHLRAHET